MSQTDLADAMTRAGHATSYQAVGNMERGVNATGPDRVYALEDVLGLRPGELASLLGYARPDVSLVTLDERVARMSRQHRDAILALVEQWDPQPEAEAPPAATSAPSRKRSRS